MTVNQFHFNYPRTHASTLTWLSRSSIVLLLLLLAVFVSLFEYFNSIHAGCRNVFLYFYSISGCGAPPLSPLCPCFVDATKKNALRWENANQSSHGWLNVYRSTSLARLLLLLLPPLFSFHSILLVTWPLCQAQWYYYYILIFLLQENEDTMKKKRNGNSRPRYGFSNQNIIEEMR